MWFFIDGMDVADGPHHLEQEAEEFPYLERDHQKYKIKNHQHQHQRQYPQLLRFKLVLQDLPEEGMFRD